MPKARNDKAYLFHRVGRQSRGIQNRHIGGRKHRSIGCCGSNQKQRVVPRIHIHDIQLCKTQNAATQRKSIGRKQGIRSKIQCKKIRPGKQYVFRPCTHIDDTVVTIGKLYILHHADQFTLPNSYRGVQVVFVVNMNISAHCCIRSQI